MFKSWGQWDERDTRTAAIGAIIAILIGLLTAYLQDILQFISSIVIFLSLLITQKFVDYLYFTASSNPLYLLIVSFLMFLFTFPTAVGLGVVIGFRRARAILRSDRQNVIQRRNREIVALATVSLLLLAPIVTSIYVPSLAYVNFHKKLAALGSVMSDHERNAYLAKWAQMSTQKDFENISKSLDDYSRSHGVTLPGLAY